MADNNSIRERPNSDQKSRIELVERKDDNQVSDPEGQEHQQNSNVDYSGAVEKTDPDEIALVKKLDRRIMPTLWAMYFMNYLDRCAITTARLNGLTKHLHLTGTQYQQAILILFVGYLGMQIPSNMLISSGKISPSWYMATCMAAWAVVSACTALVTNYPTLMVVRVLLGVAECPFFPGALFIESSFYTRKEVATRIAILYTGQILAMAFAPLIAAATFNTIDGKQGLHGWQWLFIIAGIVTFAVAIISKFFLPDMTHDTKWLTAEEKQLASQRIMDDTVGREKNKGPWNGLKQCLKDPKIYAFMLMQNLHLSACGFNNFYPSIVRSLGFSNTMSLVMCCPPYLLAAFVAFGVGKSSGHRNERAWHITAGMGLGMVGFIIFLATKHVAARYVACFLFVTGVYSINSVILGWVGATCGQTREKKAVALSLVNTLGNASYTYTPMLYKDASGKIAMGANVGFAAGTILMVWIMKLWLKKENVKIKMDNEVNDGNQVGARKAYFAY